MTPARASRWLVAGLFIALVLPLVVGLIGYRRPPWVPVLDLVMTELRVRDVFGSHTPLIGLPGRIGTLDRQGSHPGPISFYLLAGPYRLLGSTSWALQVATVLVHAGAVLTSLLLARRRGGPRLVLALAVALAAVMAGYGVSVLSEPWNPYLPLLWWMAGLLAVWSVLCGDLAMLPVAVAALSIGAQTHVPYLGLSLGMGALAVAGAAWWTRQHPADRRGLLGWGALAFGLGVLLWAPPAIDQLTNDPGNYRLLAEHFATPPEEPHGLGPGLRETLNHLDLAYHVTTYATEPGGVVVDVPERTASAGRGAVLAVLWLVAAGLSVRLAHRPLVALNAVVGAGLVLEAVAISRIFGTLWFYLMLWAWSIAALAAITIVWTGVLILRRRARPTAAARAIAVGTVVVAAVGAAVVARNVLAAPDAPHSDADVVEMAAAVVDPTAAALDAGVGAAGGHGDRYLVTWSDALHIGSPGYGLLNELERRGFDVGVPPHLRVPATEHRVLDDRAAVARVHLATGRHIEVFRGLPGAVEVAETDSRSPAERAQFERLRDEVGDDLQAAGFAELVPELDDNLFRLAVEESIPERIRRRVGTMLELGGPAAVFILPMDVPLP